MVGKGNKPATINVPGPLMEKIIEYKALMEKEKIVSPWVFFKLQDPTVHVQKETIADWVKKIGIKAGLPDDVKWSTHNLRHIFVTKIVESGKVQPEIGRLMSRHDDVKTYLGYARIEEAKVKAQNKSVFG